MYAPVRGQFGVEGRGQQWPLPDRDDPTRALVGSQNADARAGLLHPRGPDEDRVERLFVVTFVVTEPVERDVALEGVDLPAERVPADGHVDPAVGLLAACAVGQPVREHDHPGAGSERGQAGGDELAQRLQHVEGDGEPPQRGRLAAGYDQPVDSMEFLRAATVQGSSKLRPAQPQSTGVTRLKRRDGRLSSPASHRRYANRTIRARVGPGQTSWAVTRTIQGVTVHNHAWRSGAGASVTQEAGVTSRGRRSAGRRGGSPG